VDKTALLAVILLVAVVGGAIAYYTLSSRSQGVQPATTTPTTTQAYTGSTTEYKVIRVVDFANRTVEVKTPVKRLVAIGPGMLRLICYLNATDLLVGVEEVEKTWSPIGRDYAMAYGELFKNLPVIGKGGPGNPPDPEAIASVKPDLVVMSYYYLSLADPDEVSRITGAPVLVLDYSPVTSTDLTSFYKAIRILGEVLGRGERAEELVNYTESLLKDLGTRVAGVDTGSVKVYVGAVSYRGGQPFTGTQRPYPPLYWLNVKSIVDDLTNQSGFFNVDFDTILLRQPSIVFIDEGNLNNVLQDYSKDPGKYCAIEAFKSGSVYGLLPFNYYHSNLATALANAYYVGKVLFPERFSDIDPVSKANEIYSVFLGKQLYQEYLQAYPGYTGLSSMFQCSG